MPRARTIICVSAAALALSGCGGGGKENPTKSAQSGTTTGSSDRGCPSAAKPKVKHPRKRAAPSFRLARDKTYTATVVTSCGTFAMELDSKHSPRTGGSFVTLAREGFYDGLGFHRIVTSFVIQGGDPLGNGQGGPGYTIREPPPQDTVYTEGVVAMAKTETDPSGTSGSQFFVVTGDDAQLEPIYAVLGHVTNGLDVVKRIDLTPAAADGQPVTTILIKKIEIAVK